MSETITIDFRGVNFEADFYYQPEEKGDYFYPGCAEGVEDVSALKHQGTCFLELLDDYIDEIKDIILQEIKK